MSDIDDSKIVKAKKYIIQPVSFSLAKYDGDLAKIKLMVSIFDKLQDVIKKSFHQDIAELPLFSDGMNNNEIILTIRLRDITSDTNHYAEIKQLLKDIALMPIEIPVTNLKDGKRYRQYQSLCKVVIPEDSYSNEAIIRIEKEVAKVFLDASTYGYQKCLKQVIMTCRSKYTQRLYILLTAWRNKKYVTFRVDFLKSMLRLEEKYPRWYMFNQKVIDTACRELKKKFDNDVSDCYFTYELIYKGNKEEGWPYCIKFNLFLSESAKRNLEDDSLANISILCEEKMSQLGVTKRNIRTFMSRLHGNQVFEFDDFLAMLNDRIQRERYAISDVSAYATTSCRRAISMIKNKEVVTDIEDINPIGFESKESVSSMYDKEWNRFLSALSKNMDKELFDTWITPLSLADVTKLDNSFLLISLLAPSRFVADHIEANHVDLVKKHLESAFGSKVNVKYVFK